MSFMSNFIPKSGSPKLNGLGPKAQKLAALREKAAAKGAAGTTSGSDNAATAVKAKTSFAGKKTAFQRKAT
jgi:hypothetical protein